MGCDIHTVIERRIAKGLGGHPDKWVAVAIDPETASERNYARFAALAGVRGDGPLPLGMPKDASDTAMLLSRDWGADGHSHSHMALKKAAKIYARTDSPGSEINAKWPLSCYFGIDDENENAADYRLVFWFDN